MTVTKLMLEKTISQGALPCCFLKLTIPQIEGNAPSSVRMNRYFLRFRDRILRSSEFLQRAAKKKLAASLAQGLPFTPYSLTMDFTVTRNDAAYFSLYSDVTTKISARPPLTERYGDTFQAPSGFLLSMDDFFREKGFKKKILRQMEAQMALQTEKRPHAYYDHPKKLMKKHFSKEHCYLSEKCLVVYYPLYALAPLSAGLPAFSIPLQEA